MKKLGFIIILLSFIIIGCKSPDDPWLWKNGRIPFKLISPRTPGIESLYKAMVIWSSMTGGKINFVDMSLRDASDEERVLNIYLSNKFPDNMIMTFLHNYHQFTDMEMIVNSDLYYFHSDSELVGFFCHELGHVLGLDIHEFQRFDTSMYLKFNEKHLKKQSLLVQYQFIPKEPRFYDARKYPFDYQSIMMYPEDIMRSFFIIDEEQKISSNLPSALDCSKVVDMYADFNWEE